MKKKIACVIYYDTDFYKSLANVASESFKKWNPEVDLFLISPDKINDYNLEHNSYVPGIRKYAIAYHLMDKLNYNKVIALGADTITCARLDEFLDYDDDVIATLDYPYQLKIGAMETPIVQNDHTHLNADVICFNNKEALLNIIEASIRLNFYNEQGGLNWICWSGVFNYTLRLPEFPYKDASVLYNVRSKGNMCDNVGNKPWNEFIKKFKVQDNKLLTYDNRWIKVWHYCDGFGNLGHRGVEQAIQQYKNIIFNKETKDFFENHCNSNGFFI